MDNEGEDKSYQAYQALGMLILNPGMEVSDEEAKRALDYFSGIDEYDENFLPWPRVEEEAQVGKDIITGLKQAVDHAEQMNQVEAVAEEWARIDGKLDRYLADKAGKLEANDGTYQGYNTEAKKFLERLNERGFILVRTMCSRP